MQLWCVVSQTLGDQWSACGMSHVQLGASFCVIMWQSKKHLLSVS